MIKIALGLAGVTVGAAVVLAVVGWPGDLYRDSDWMQYYAGSRALLEGASPYDHAWWAAFHERVGSEALSAPPRTGNIDADWTTPYPVPTFIALLPFAVFPLRMAEPLFVAVQVAMVFGASLSLASAILARPRRVAPIVLALVVGSQPFWVLVAGGNVTGFAAAFFTLGLAAVASGRARLAGVLLAGCLLKPHLFALGAVVLFLVTPAGERRRLVSGAALGAALLLIPAFVLDPGWIAEWSREASRLQQTSASNATGWTIARPFISDFRLASAIVIVLAVGGLGAWWMRARPALPGLMAAAMPVSVLVAPHGWSYDYIAALPTIVVMSGVASASRHSMVALSALVAFAVFAPWALYIVAFQRNGEDLSAWLLVAAEVAVIASYRPLAAPGGVVRALAGRSRDAMPATRPWSRPPRS